MRLSELPHTVVDYRTFGMEGCEEPLMGSLVKLLVIEDRGERVLLEYSSPKRRPEPKPLMKALAKVGVGATGTVVLQRTARTPQDLQQRKVLIEKLASLVSNWSEADIAEAFNPRRGEGYYRRHGQHEKYYEGPIHA